MIIEQQAWLDGTVPPKVLKIMYFIHNERLLLGVSPTWAEIAIEGGWSHRPRREWRNKMRYLKRFGVEWAPNQQYSTRVKREVVPYLIAAVQELQSAAL